MNECLETITIRLPVIDPQTSDDVASLLQPLGSFENGTFHARQSDVRFFPRIAIEFQSNSVGVHADFVVSSGETLSVTIANTTGTEKRHPQTYTPVSARVVSERLAASGIDLVSIDHFGFNLPWFSVEPHPSILELRRKLSPRCLYHRYPSGEPWDFILPGDEDEIGGRKAIDYNRTRRPKFELVSFDQSSTALMQIDVGVAGTYERFSRLFPESLADPRFGNVWAYLDTPYPIDVCLVINENRPNDWSIHFKESRL